MMIPRDMKKLSLAEMEYLVVASSKQRKKVMKARKRWVKYFAMLATDMVAVYPNQQAYQLVVTLCDEDTAWKGDFDVIRPELGQLLDELLRFQLLPEATNNLVNALEQMTQKGSLLK